MCKCGTEDSRRVTHELPAPCSQGSLTGEKNTQLHYKAEGNPCYRGGASEFHRNNPFRGEVDKVVRTWEGGSTSRAKVLRFMELEWET